MYSKLALVEINHTFFMFTNFIFSSPVRMYRKSYCTTPGFGIGIGIGSSGMDKMLKFYFKVF